MVTEKKVATEKRSPVDIARRNAAKGAEFERDIMKRFNALANTRAEALGISVPKLPFFHRNRNQAGYAGADINNPFGLQIECKNCQKIETEKWWQQVMKAARQYGGIPVVVWKVQGTRRIQAMLPGTLYGGRRRDDVKPMWSPVIIDETTLLEWVAHRIDVKFQQK